MAHYSLMDPVEVLPRLGNYCAGRRPFHRKLAAAPVSVTTHTAPGAAAADRAGTDADGIIGNCCCMHRWAHWQSPANRCCRLGLRQREVRNHSSMTVGHISRRNAYGCTRRCIGSREGPMHRSSSAKIQF